MGYENTIQQLVIDQMSKACAETWGSVKSVGVTLAYGSSDAGGDDVYGSPEQQLECETLCRTFIRRFADRTAPYGTIRTAHYESDTGEGEYGFMFVLKPPTNIEPRILEKIIKDCWDHCPSRITSFFIEDQDGHFAAQVEFGPPDSSDDG